MKEPSPSADSLVALLERQDLSPRSVTTYVSLLRRVFSTLDLSLGAALSEAEAAVFFDHLVAEGASRSTVQTAVCALASYARAQGRGWNPAHPALSRARRAALLATRRKQRSPREPVGEAMVNQALRAAPQDGLKATRDRALLALLYAGALRRSDAVALCLRDVVFCEEGVILSFPFEKTNTFGRRVTEIGISPARAEDVCPVGLLQTWLEARRAAFGADPEAPLFLRLDPASCAVGAARALSTVAVNTTVVDLLRPVCPKGRIGSHSLRAGWVTDRLEEGHSHVVLMQHTRHKSLASFAAYYRPDKPVGFTALKRAG